MAPLIEPVPRRRTRAGFATFMAAADPDTVALVAPSRDGRKGHTPGYPYLALIAVSN